MTLFIRFISGNMNLNMVACHFLDQASQLGPLDFFGRGILLSASSKALVGVQAYVKDVLGYSTPN